MADDKKKPIKLNDEQLMLDASQVADIYHQLTIDLFDQVIDRVKERGSASLDDNPYIWQLEKMNEMGLLNEDNLKLISDRSGIAEEQLRYVIQNEGYQIYKDTKQQLLDATGSGSFVANSLIQTNLAAYVNQTMGDINNLINTTLPKSVMGAYQSIIEEATAKVVTGLATSDKAIADTVMKWAKKGFYGFTDSQGKRWKADTYARQVIKSTAWRVYREVRMAPAEEMGIDTFYYSKKSTAREMCAPLQHQIVTTGVARTEKGERILALSDYGYGTAGGCLGINCTHEITPFVVGANYKPELGDDVKDLTPEQAIENANVQAKQRALERSIRQSKEFLHVAEKLGDRELIDKYKNKVRIQQGAMRDYLRQHPFLHRDYAREKYYDDPYTKTKKEIKVRKELEKLEKHRAEQKEMRQRFTSAVKDGIIKAEINEQKQSDHIRGTNEWYRRLETDLANGKQFEPSYLTVSIDEAAKLIKRYSGTGKFLYKEDPTYIPKKEIIKHDSKIGMYIDQSTGEMFETDSFRIHYRKTGAHIVPTYGGKS
ncbi:phage minor capsid protein [Streptococcus uberis]|uniref:Capsid protein n=1 Tax=Streptococcus uberis TaxID=1349 RepID=A0A6L6G9H6_STRUB|nr:phage minor capsid protein [Streptococcus uberis]MTB36156.1 capsid protein [Streptococcus uberis]MTB36976.1 capsid protein [Streptococcus uberis]MTB55782.1 capsid protein [Streptococcus uberis]MTB60554.1 capsid protein [Streptococcus uberis]MTC86063.1 capsid protein [Streptococcus uberis]